MFLIEGRLGRSESESIADSLLADPTTETATITCDDDSADHDGDNWFEVHSLPGVTDPVAQTTLSELRAERFSVERVRTAWAYRVVGDVDPNDMVAAMYRVLANDCIQKVIVGRSALEPAPRPPLHAFRRREVALRALDGAALARLSREGHLFLNPDEMRAIREHFRRLEREPSDLELETLAQTWSEHCVHKTLKSAVVYRGAPFPGRDADAEVEVRYDNLLADTIARATRELIEQGRGPCCLSVFEDNAGVIEFDDEFGIAFKVETHNHPSAIEPYGGAATGIGGCIRDVLGCGLGAAPIANTDVFCVAPSDWPADRLPTGVLHPERVLRGIAAGVADYGNRMGIPTVNGAIHFDPRYLGNPLVYCGCAGLIPRDRIEKAARPGDRIVVIGGRTGRDGIHGATFSSAELSDTHADEFSHAVQIGDAITEKRCADAILRARDAAGGCLYTALTDCGAGGLSSAVGEMGEHVGASVELSKVPLKYAGLRYDEIWISEAQERMVLAVPDDTLSAFLEVTTEEGVEATVIGRFGACGPSGEPVLRIFYDERVVGELGMRFLHHGLPKRERRAEWTPPSNTTNTADRQTRAETDWLTALQARLSDPEVASKEWVIRRYDHEVQGGSVIKPLMGPGAGPTDAAVITPCAGSDRAVVIGCGFGAADARCDPYWMAISAVDEAIRNVVSVGGDPTRTALLDNFCWGRVDEPQQFGGLVRACQACYDAAIAYATPFISGKDSLNNEFALAEADVATLVETLGSYDRALGAAAADEIRSAGRLRIPETLLISAISVIEDASACISPDLKSCDNDILLVGPDPHDEPEPADFARIHDAVAGGIRRSAIVSCHDVSDGGWLATLAEMAIGGRRGAILDRDPSAAPTPFSACYASYVVESPAECGLVESLRNRGVCCSRVGRVSDDRRITLAGESIELATLDAAWRGGDRLG